MFSYISAAGRLILYMYSFLFIRDICLLVSFVINLCANGWVESRFLSRMERMGECHE